MQVTVTVNGEDHTRDIERFCRLMKIRLLLERTYDVRGATDLARPAKVYAS